MDKDAKVHITIGSKEYTEDTHIKHLAETIPVLRTNTTFTEGSAISVTGDTYVYRLAPIMVLKLPIPFRIYQNF